MNTKENVVQNYEKILNGTQKTFSPYFFQPQHRKSRLGILLRYFIEEKMNYTPEIALQKLTLKDFGENSLSCILKYIDKPVEFLDDDIRHIVYFAYPEIPQPSRRELVLMTYDDLLCGRRKTFPKNYFLNGQEGEERAIICFQYLCEDILKLEKKDIAQVFSGSESLKILAQYKLKIIMNILFNSIVDLLESAYPKETHYPKC